MARPHGMSAQSHRARRSDCRKTSEPRGWGVLTALLGEGTAMGKSALEHEAQQTSERRRRAQRRRRIVRYRRRDAPRFRDDHHRSIMAAVNASRAGSIRNKSGPGSKLASEKSGAGRRRERALRVGGESAGSECQCDGGGSEERFHRQGFRRPARAPIQNVPGAICRWRAEFPLVCSEASPS